MSEYDEKLDELNDFLKERFKYFLDNVFPDLHEMIVFIAQSKRIYPEITFGFNESSFVKDRLKFIIDCWFTYGREADDKSLHKYRLIIKYKYRTVLRYTWQKDATPSPITLTKFVECDWISKIKDIYEYLKKEDIKLYQKYIDKKFKKACKDFEVKCKND